MVSCNKPRIIFAGTPEFAAKHLQGLHEAGFDVALVLTQPDAKVGRGRKTKPSPVKAYALEHDIAVAQPERLRDNPEAVAQLIAIEADWMVVVAYGLILPAQILDATRHGCLNVHGSLLPRWRGAAPVQRAIESRDLQTGICIMQMDEGLDTGPVRYRLSTPITQETSEELLEVLAPLGVQGLVDVLQDPQLFPPVAQPEEGVTYAEKITKYEKAPDWSQSSLDLQAKVRAMQPWPCISVSNAQFQFKILKSSVGSLSLKQHEIGSITAVSSSGLEVACGDGSDRILIEKIQLAGGKPVALCDFLNGKADFFKVGDSLLTEA